MRALAATVRTLRRRLASAGGGTLLRTGVVRPRSGPRGTGIDGSDLGGHDLGGHDHGGRDVPAGAPTPAPASGPADHARHHPVVVTPALKIRRRAAEDEAGAVAPWTGGSMGRRLHATTAGVVVLGWGVAGAAALALTDPDTGASAAPAPSAPHACRHPCHHPGLGPHRRHRPPSAADRARLARLRDETARLEREVRILQARLARKPARTATSAAPPPRTRPGQMPPRATRPTSPPAPAPAPVGTTTGGDHHDGGGGGDD